jgi:transcriptional regulator with XRE-family HTH domain
MSRANSAGEILLLSRYRAKRMTLVTNAATDSQAFSYRHGDRRTGGFRRNVAGMARTGADHFRKRLADHREATGATLQAIADKVGVAKSTIQRYETAGKKGRVPEEQHWHNIAAVLGCYVEELFLPPDVAQVVHVFLKAQGKPLPALPENKKLPIRKLEG